MKCIVYISRQHNSTSREYSPTPNARALPSPACPPRPARYSHRRARRVSRGANTKPYWTPPHFPPPHKSPSDTTTSPPPHKSHIRTHAATLVCHVQSMKCIELKRSSPRGGYRISPRGGRLVMNWCLNAIEWYIFNGESPSQGWAPAPAPIPWIRA